VIFISYSIYSICGFPRILKFWIWLSWGVGNNRKKSRKPFFFYPPISRFSLHRSMPMVRRSVSRRTMYKPRRYSTSFAKKSADAVTKRVVYKLYKSVPTVSVANLSSV